MLDEGHGWGFCGVLRLFLRAGDQTGILKYVMDANIKSGISIFLEEESNIMDHEASFRLTFEKAAVGIAHISRSGGFLRVNRKLCEILGYSEPELLQISFHEITHTADLDGNLELKTALLDGKIDTFVSENRYHRKDGSIVWAHLSTTLAVDDAGDDCYFISVLQDITARKEAEMEIIRLNRLYSVLSDVNQTVVRRRNRDELLAEVCRIIVEVGQFPLAWVGLLEQGASQIRVMASCGRKIANFKNSVLAVADPAFERSLTGAAIRSGRYHLNNRLETVDLINSWLKIAPDCGIRSTAAFPIRVGAQTIGNLTIYATEQDHFQTAEINLLNELVTDVSYALEVMEQDKARRAVEAALLQSYENQNTIMLQTVHALARTVEMRDPYTAGHQEKVSRLAVAIATEMSLAAERIKAVQLAALVHDIGKIHVPAEILSKPGRLTDIEFQLIKSHSQLGYDILTTIEFPWPIAEIVLQHHERLDGSGYPRSRRERDLLLEAKILAVADVVEAMTSHRPYRPALGLEKALSEITGRRGKLYDGDVVDACVRLVVEKGYVIA